ncbi:helix-turn-helix domain-containing protein [Pseudobutyrivibrio sp. UC1225]|uniref:helix-turn-helix domain-containing protein n=1 Tax=Pseudobutyrivibrio sp. UC1225 TaxID=1798185 RepID=UPI000B810A25|nr:helix-turn-helix transcriptional regulator [Pseudobutyrivibrio sp. UC1225]
MQRYGCQRKLYGLSQSELAREAGINLRTLQQYEIGAKDINKAAAATVLSLSKVLKCRPEDLCGE